MRTSTPHAVRGFSILETMIAMAVLAISLLGTLGALNRAATEARLGQNRQMKMALADATLQRIKLQDKGLFFVPSMPAQPTVDITALPVGTAPWVLDPSTSSDPLDFSTGAYFNILPDGTLLKLSIAGNPPCTSNTVNAVPDGTICREVYTHQGGPYSATNATFPADAGLPGTVREGTAWVRITRKTSTTSHLDSEIDVLLNEVVVQ